MTQPTTDTRIFRTLETAWLDISGDTINADANPEAVAAMRNFFYAGALAALLCIDHDPVHERLMTEARQNTFAGRVQ